MHTIESGRKCFLISHNVQLSPNGVIPGLPARAEPGIQRFCGRISWIPGSASRPRNDGLSLRANQEMF